MSKHTPGPWHIWSLGSRDMYIGPPQDISQPAVAIVPLRVSTRDAQLPNARLVAAAPELLQALLNLVGTMCAADGSDMEADLDAIDAKVEEARAAIAKATGSDA